MPDMFLQDPGPVRKKRRSFRIEIDNPMGSPKTIKYHQEDVLVDSGGVKITSEMAPSIITPFMEVATTVYLLNDPVTGNAVSISGAAIAMWIELDYIARAQVGVEGVSVEA